MVPVLPFLVGITQSNISIPEEIANKISSGKPTPIRYLGLSSGKSSAVYALISLITDVGSPTATPPMAYPWNSSGTISSTALFLRWG